MKAYVNSGRQSMIDERFRFGLQGLGLDSLVLHCLIRQGNLLHFISLCTGAITGTGKINVGY